MSDKSFHQFLKTTDVEIIRPKKLSFYKDEQFFNMNRPEDFNQIQKLIQAT